MKSHTEIHEVKIHDKRSQKKKLTKAIISFAYKEGHNYNINSIYAQSVKCSTNARLANSSVVNDKEKTPNAIIQYNHTQRCLSEISKLKTLKKCLEV